MTLLESMVGMTFDSVVNDNNDTLTFKTSDGLEFVEPKKLRRPSLP